MAVTLFYHVLPDSSPVLMLREIISKVQMHCVPCLNMFNNN